MQALAVGGKFVFVVGEPASGCEVALAVLPGDASLATPFDSPLLIIVVRVVGTTLPVQFAFQPSLPARIGLQFLA